MTLVTDKHFGANLVLTINSVQEGSPFLEMLKEISFTEFRYPGGSVTENSTWENGKMAAMFGPPMDPEDQNFVTTIREALRFCRDMGVPMNLVIPTKQFFDFNTGTFREEPFGRYVRELEKALGEFRGVKISGFEIGNEYWDHEPEKGFPSLAPGEYAKVVSAEVPVISAMADRLAAASGGRWEKPGIGVQAGAQWRKTFIQESREIIEGLSTDVRGQISKVYQHHYPSVNKGDYQLHWAFDAVAEFSKAPGFPPDLEVVISEFNISGEPPGGADKPFQYGVRVAGQWAEEFGKTIDAGADVFHHWGLQYKTLDKKFYDRGVDEDGNPTLAATPLGMIYDLSRKHLIGKSTITDEAAASDLIIPRGVTITGFEDENQRVVYLHNRTSDEAGIRIGEETMGRHVTAYLMVAADDPSTEKDESIILADGRRWPNSRADMRVVSGSAIKGGLVIPAEGILVIVTTEQGVAVDIEGARRETDPRAGMADDVIIGGQGRDILKGYAGDDRIEGGDGADVLFGGSGADALFGGDGDDVLFSDSGADNLSPGDGDDLVLIAGSDGRVTVDLRGSGNNTILTSGERTVTITGFGNGDKIGLNRAFGNADDLITAVSDTGSGAMITLPSGAEILLSGYSGSPEQLAGRVFDFMPAEEARSVIAEHLSGMREAQVEIVLSSGQGLGALVDGGDAWPGIEEVHTPEDQSPSWPDDGRAPDPESSPLDEDPETGDEETPQDPSSASGGGCFVATAAYGHRSHPDVIALRRFRDGHLVRYSVGRALVRAYWVIGPIMADRISPRSVGGIVFRGALSGLTRCLRKAGLTEGR